MSAEQQQQQPQTTTKLTDTTESTFTDIDADNDIDRITTIESACLHCGGTGMTRLLLTRIPYFRDVIVMSFECNNDNCNARYSELQAASDLQPTGVRYVLRIDEYNKEDIIKQDLNRQIIKSDTAIIRIPEILFESTVTGHGEINTIEGIVTQIHDNILGQLPYIKERDLNQANQLQNILDRLNDFSTGKQSFTFELDDPAGNSYIENPIAPKKDIRCKIQYYERTQEQTQQLGFQVQENNDDNNNTTTTTSDILQQQHDNNTKSITVDKSAEQHLNSYFNVTDRMSIIPGICHQCHQSCETRICITNLPHFKDCALMVTDCEHCGYKDSEVKPAGVISDKALRIILKVQSTDDLSRDILKSDTASIIIPELELELQSGTLGGKYTTVEGILNDIKQQLERTFAFQLGDSATNDDNSNDTNSTQEFLNKFNKLFDVDQPFTFILDDPIANIYIYNPHTPNDDPQLEYIEYDRTQEQNDDLGISDINVDPEQYLSDKHKQLLTEIDDNDDNKYDNVEDDVSEKYKKFALSNNDHNDNDNNDEDELHTAAAEYVKHVPVKIGGLIPDQSNINKSISNISVRNNNSTHNTYTNNTNS